MIVRVHHYLTPRRVFLLATALLLLLIIGRVITQTVWASSSESRSGQHVLRIYDDGVEQGILTDANTLREALGKAGIELAANDITEPALDSQLVAAAYDVNIYRARPVMVVDGETATKVMTPYRTAKQIAKQADVELRAEDIVRVEHGGDIVLTGALERMVIDRAHEVTLVFYGETTTLYTHVDTVGELLTERDIVPGSDDTLSVAAEAPIVAGMTIELWRNGKQTATVDEDVAFTTREIRDADKPAGYKEVQTKGVNGQRKVTYEIEMRNGVEVNRHEINSVETKPAVQEVVVIGAHFVYTGGPLNDAQITALGMCESGMTANRNSGNGFYGAFQFMPATWRSVAPAPYNTGMPHEAPLDAQKQAVQNLLSRSSIYTQFPGCARKMQAQGLL